MENIFSLVSFIWLRILRFSRRTFSIVSRNSFSFSGESFTESFGGFFLKESFLKKRCDTSPVTKPMSNIFKTSEHTINIFMFLLILYLLHQRGMPASLFPLYCSRLKTRKD